MMKSGRRNREVHAFIGAIEKKFRLIGVYDPTPHAPVAQRGGTKMLSATNVSNGTAE
jgi:hypothetical protein